MLWHGKYIFLVPKPIRCLGRKLLFTHATYYYVIFYHVIKITDFITFFMAHVNFSINILYSSHLISFLPRITVMFFLIVYCYNNSITNPANTVLFVNIQLKISNIHKPN